MLAHNPSEQRVMRIYRSDYSTGNRCETPHADYRSQIATTTRTHSSRIQRMEAETLTAATLLEVTESKYSAG
jgi:hypothetical protein